MIDTKRFLNLGCGDRFESDWTNLDFRSSSLNVRSHNLLENLPFEYGQFELVHSSHVLEHFEGDAGVRLLGEMFRVFRRGGTVRVVVPDLELISKNYLHALGARRLAPIEPRAIANHRWANLTMLDQASRSTPGGAMIELLRRVGGLRAN